MMGKCALCGEDKELQLSHIIPKFIGKYLKNTSIGNIRSHENPNRIAQDIEKHYMLCHDCEELFSASERYFAILSFIRISEINTKALTMTKNFFISLHRYLGEAFIWIL